MQEVYVWLYVRELVDVFFEYKPVYMIWYEKKFIPKSYNSTKYKNL